MAILFLTSSLEPGRDGVGDYTRLLAGECIRQNRPCCIIALNDAHVSEPVEAIDNSQGTPIQTLRLPANLGWEKRIMLALDFRLNQKADWISLQFVGYGFDPRGMAGNLTQHLAPLVTGIPLHIMFHELWLGIGDDRPLKKRLLGYFQRQSIRNLVRRLRPRVITTTNPYYRELFEKVGIPAVELPLFGNIPALPIADNLYGGLKQAGWVDESGSHPDRWLGLFFGALYSEWKPEPFMSALISAAKKTQRRASLVSAGRLGANGEKIWRDLASKYNHEVDFLTLGELPPAQISALMQVADFGLAASPWYLLGKSGSVAAMLDHGLPVIVTRDDFQPAVTAHPNQPLFHRCDTALESKLVAGLPKGPVRQSLPDRAADFIRLLAST